MEEEVNVTLEDLNEFFDQPSNSLKSVQETTPSASALTVDPPLFLSTTTTTAAPIITTSEQAVSSTTQNGSSAKQSSSAAVAAAAEIAMDPTERNKMSLRLRPRLFQTDVDSKRPRKSLADLLSEYNSTKLNAQNYMNENDVLDLDQLDLPKNPQDYTEEQLETVIATKMREYRISIMREYGPYSNINLQELLNPADRLESIILFSARRHGMNNLHLDSLATNAIKMIETEQQLIRRLNAIAKILQNDDPDWPGQTFSDGEEEVVKARGALQEWLFNDAMYVEKMQEIRDRVTYIYDKKMELLRILKERFTPY